MVATTRREALALGLGLTSAALAGCSRNASSDGATEDGAKTKTLRVLATSDLHGKLVPWDYPSDEESTVGSIAQLATAIGELRDDDTLLVDAGDTIQDNMAELFIDDDVHPMVACLNALRYDVGVTGNHEYNFGMDVVRKTIAAFEGKVLTGNVWDENGDAIADGYTIIDKNGVRVGLIGMVTPNISVWDRLNLADCVVTNPVEETRKIIDQIAGDVDVLVGVYHMGLENEFEVEGSGVRDLANACPEFDLIVAAHEHLLVEGEEINGVLVVENKAQAETLANVVLTLERDGEGWKVTDRVSEPVTIAGYDANPDIIELATPYDERAKTYAREVIGRLEGEQLSPDNEIANIPTAVIQDTALIDLINDVQLHYTGAVVSAAALFIADSNIKPGDIRRCDVSKIYKYTNTLYTMEMTGAQLRKFMEWSADFYRQWQPGDLTLGFNPDKRMYNYDMFQGVTYEVNVAKEAGERIEGLAWPDGTPVVDDDVFVIAVNNYRASSQLLGTGSVFEEGDELPKLLEVDVHGEIGGIRELIADYIGNVKAGTIRPELTENWRVIGNDWDPDLHGRAVELLAEGKLTLTESEDSRDLASAVITEEDLAAV